MLMELQLVDVTAVSEGFFNFPEKTVLTTDPVQLLPVLIIVMVPMYQRVALVIVVTMV